MIICYILMTCKWRDKSNKICLFVFIGFSSGKIQSTNVFYRCMSVPNRISTIAREKLKKNNRFRSKLGYNTLAHTHTHTHIVFSSISAQKTNIHWNFRGIRCDSMMRCIYDSINRTYATLFTTNTINQCSGHDDSCIYANAYDNDYMHNSRRQITCTHLSVLVLNFRFWLQCKKNVKRCDVAIVVYVLNIVQFPLAEQTSSPIIRYENRFTISGYLKCRKYIQNFSIITETNINRIQIVSLTSDALSNYRTKW